MVLGFAAYTQRQKAGPDGAHVIRGLTTDYMTPHSHTIRETPAGQMMFDAELVTEPDIQLFDADAWGDRARAHSEGRSTVWQVQTAQGSWLLKHYWRGGLIARVISRRYWFTGFARTRMVREYRLLTDLYRAGLPVPRPVAALVQRHCMLLYSGSLLTEFLDGTYSLASRVESDASDDIPWEAVGGMIRRFHDEAVMHHDLNASNILLGPKGPHLIDFDKGHRVTGSRNADWIMGNLRRLRRSLDKLSTSEALLDAGWTRLRQGYDQGE